MKRQGLVAWLPSLTAGAWFAIDKLLPDLLPPVPRPWAWAIVALSVLVAALALGVQALLRVRARVPGPWTARPIWSTLRWLRERPRVSILTAAASAEFGVSTLDQLRIRLTIHRSVERATASCRIDFEQAILTLIQDDRQGQRRLRLVPVEAGGFLALPLASRRSDSVVIDFVPTTLPLPSARAPDLHKPFALELRSVHAEIQTRRPMSGRLPIAALVVAPPA